MLPMYYILVIIISGTGWHVFYFLSCLHKSVTVSFPHGFFCLLSMPTVFGSIVVSFICDTSNLGLFCDCESYPNINQILARCCYSKGFSHRDVFYYCVHRNSAELTKSVNSFFEDFLWFWCRQHVEGIKSSCSENSTCYLCIPIANNIANFCLTNRLALSKIIYPLIVQLLTPSTVSCSKLLFH